MGSIDADAFGVLPATHYAYCEAVCEYRDIAGDPNIWIEIKLKLLTTRKYQWMYVCVYYVSVFITFTDRVSTIPFLLLYVMTIYTYPVVYGVANPMRGMLDTKISERASTKLQRECPCKNKTKNDKKKGKKNKTKNSKYQKG